MPPPQQHVVLDATRAKDIDGRRVSRWFQQPVCRDASVAAAAAIIGWGLFAPGRANAQTPSFGEPPPVTGVIQFLSAEATLGGEPIAQIGPLRAGHATLWWSAAPSATAYRLRTSAGASIYHGHLPRAFVFGLPDGEHRFVIEAIDTSGEVVARSAKPLVVQVQHWDSQTAWLLFAIGAIVVAVLLIVLLVGMSRAREVAGEPPAASEQASAGHSSLPSAGDHTPRDNP